MSPFVGDLRLADNGTISAPFGTDSCLGLWEVSGITYVCGVRGMKESPALGMGRRLMDRVFCFSACLALDSSSFCWMNSIRFLVSSFLVIDDACCFLYLTISVPLLSSSVCSLVTSSSFAMSLEPNPSAVRIKYGVTLDAILIVVFKANY